MAPSGINFTIGDGDKMVSAANAGFLYSDDGTLECDGHSVKDILDKLNADGHIDRRPFILQSAAKIAANVKQIKEHLGRAQLVFPLNAKHSEKLIQVLKKCKGVSAQVQNGY